MVPYLPQFTIVPQYLNTCVLCRPHLLGNCTCFPFLKCNRIVFFSVSPSSVNKTSNILLLRPRLKVSSFIFRNHSFAQDDTRHVVSVQSCMQIRTRWEVRADTVKCYYGNQKPKNIGRPSSTVI